MATILVYTAQGEQVLQARPGDYNTPGHGMPELLEEIREAIIKAGLIDTSRQVLGDWREEYTQRVGL